MITILYFTDIYLIVDIFWTYIRVYFIFDLYLL